ncbi:hypothetical protein FGG08_004887 [Glutinoglossum americanum]|uniref:Ankyrin n=1 Tax=Glutinoglossum americanum TaxID=1670608 RepID=A0A9P8KWJ8_9PEZI|nr:hypothetical protein FGG08_004887 [Glutinoglossum americanum]
MYNPDQRADSSLHIAAREGLLDVAAFLIEAGHEDEGFSRNANGDTALMFASSAGHEEIVDLIASRFPDIVSVRNKAGLTALMLAAQSGSSTCITTLLAHDADPDLADDAGNTALHYASAHGALKALRTLVFASTNPLPQNYYSWTPLSYSSTVQAEVYFKNLLAERARREAKAEQQQLESAGAGIRPGGLRLVVGGDAVGVLPGREDGQDSSPREVAVRSQTPTLGRSEKMAFTGRQRMRASSGD